MQTIEASRRKIQTAEDLYSVVKTMKALAAVSIRQYEKVVQALAAYNRTVELGVQIALQAQAAPLVTHDESAVGQKVGAIVFGSDQGMCGQFNERIVSHTIETLNGMHVPRARRQVASVGLRSAALLNEAGQKLSAKFFVPSGIAGITEMMHELLITIEDWRLQEGVDRLYLFHNHLLGGATYRPQTVQVLPLDSAWLTELQTRSWPTKVLPTFHMEWDKLFSALIRQVLFIRLYQACAESMASEEASRLAAMQNAERNIEDRLQELTHQYHHQRQASIMAELLDITAGYEAVMQN